MSSRWVVASVIAAALAAAAIAAASFGLSHGVAILAVCAACAVPISIASHVLARRRDALGSLGRQFAAGMALSIGLVLLGVGAIALLMFVPAEDALLLAALLVFAGALAAYSAMILGRGVRADISSLRDRVVAVGAGGPVEEPLVTGGADELADLAAAVERMEGRLRQREAERDAADKARRDLIAAVSHDLRTPLTSLRLLADGIDDGLLESGAGSGRYMREMAVHVRAMSTLVDDLFELTRLESGEINWSMQRVQLDELVGETVEAMRSQAARKRIAMRADIPGGLPPARGNPEGLQRVLFNLIQNAIRYTPADGSVTIVASPAGSALAIEVSDSGAGIAAEERERVFEPFFRGRAEASRTSDGAGLGLSICRAIVEVHGGTIQLEPSAAGTRVRFTVPVAA